MLTLWGQLAERSNAMVGNVVAYKQVRIGTFSGVSLNSGFSTEEFVNDRIGHKRVGQLRQWYQKTGGDLSSVKELTESRDSPTGERKQRLNLIQEIIDAEEDPTNYHSERDSKFFEVSAQVTHIKTDDNTVFPSCPTCQKKVIQDGEDWSCENCDKRLSKPTWKYILTLKIEDCTNVIYVKCFGDKAQQIMGTTMPNEFRAL